MDAVYFYLGDSYFLWNKADESAPYLTKLITDHPKSKFAEEGPGTAQGDRSPGQGQEVSARGGSDELSS